MTKNRLLFMLAMLLASISTFGLSPSKTFNGLWIERKSGEKVGYLFTQKPEINYSGTKMVVTAGSAQAEFDVTDIANISFSDDVEATAIRSLAETDHRTELIQVEAGSVHLSGFKSGEVVTVYDANGHQLSQLRTDADGQTTVQFTSLPKGLYIVRAGQNAVKIKN